MMSQHWLDNGLVLSGTMPLSEPMLTQIYVTIGHLKAITYQNMISFLQNILTLGTPELTGGGEVWGV